MQIARVIFQRSLAGIYLLAFIGSLKQFPALLGERGLLPVPDFIRSVPFKDAPSIFYIAYSDKLFVTVAWIGIALSVLLMAGIFDRSAWWVPMAVWLVIWALYLSIVNVGQTFYSFGWETMLCEAGFLAAFLGTSKYQVSLIPILALRWMLFRTELGAGLIKIRGDQCWRDLTCLFYHFETQPMPNPLSWFFFYIPKVFLKTGVVFSHFVQTIAPFGLLGPARVAACAGILIIIHQLMLIVSGNYSWLNWLTVVLAVTAFSDPMFGRMMPFTAPLVIPRPAFYDSILYLFAALILVLSIQPAMNFFSRHQLMNYSYNPLHLVDSYGAFGTVTKERYEIVVEGTDAPAVNAKTRWKEYEFIGKPGDLKRMPPQIAPYHLRLDWLMWFLPFSVSVTKDGILSPGQELWFLRFIEKLLEGDMPTIRLLRSDPFPGKPPHFIRARFYRYQFTGWNERQKTGAWWKRTLIDDYLPPVALGDLQNI